MSEDEKTVLTEKAGAKEQSRIAMLFASVWIAVFTVLKAVKIIDIDMNDIILSAIAIVGVWSPTYLSIWLDKIKDIKLVGK